MAVTETELLISNKSYTDKDFASIYSELVEQAIKLSYKYDPTNTNESDPFIVILKEIAFVADKLNYAVDKALLERFISSCTQQSSMRELTEMLGYSMHYYLAAETTVCFKYDFANTSDENLEYIIVPQYSKVLNDTKDIQYTTWENASIQKSSKTSQEVKAIQGTLNTLTILGSPVVLLENLDQNNRVYFPEIMVAENGVIITGGSGTQGYWTAVDNLNIQEYNSAVFKFGYDSIENLPYIEFPEWISNIIGNGLTIKYVVTSGVQGNVKARTLTSVSRNGEMNDNVSDEDITVVNINSATAGSDPETIDEAYAGFKKTIGTFNTLVTCRDYSNAIYNLKSFNGNYIVSNLVVSDRRDDLNDNTQVMSYTENGEEILNIRNSNFLGNFENAPGLVHEGDIYYNTTDNTYYMKIGATGSTWVQTLKNCIQDKMTAFDLKLYAMNPIIDKSYLSANSYGGYNSSFNRLMDYSSIINNEDISDYNCIAHNFKNPETDEIFSIKNKFKLTGIITTNQKVNSVEQLDIIKNVNNALIDRYNARELDFGSEIAFDDLVNTIESSDERIKSIAMYEPEQTPYITTVTNDGLAENKLFDNDGNPQDSFKVILAKNILGGRVSLFSYDTNFEYNPDEAIKSIDYGIKSFTSCLGRDQVGNLKGKNIAVGSGAAEEPPVEAEITLDANEVVQFITPELSIVQPYTYGILYHLKLNNGISYEEVKTEPENWNTTWYTYYIKNADSDTYTKNTSAIWNSELTYAKGTKSTNVSTIPAGADYKLKAGEKLLFEWIESGTEKERFAEYGEGDIISSNFTLYSTDVLTFPNLIYSRGQTPSKIITYKGARYDMFTLGTNDEIDYKVVNKEILDTNKKCYWQTKRLTSDGKSSRIEWKQSETDTSKYEYILDVDECFFYTDPTFTTLIEFGSGTKLEIPAELYNQGLSWTCSKNINIDKLTQDGLSGLGESFIDFSFTKDNTLTLTRQEILTLAEGDEIQIINKSTDGAESLFIPNNEWGKVNNKLHISYRLLNSNDAIDLIDKTELSEDLAWRCRGLLDVCAGPDLAQTIKYPQSITFETTSGESIVISPEGVEEKKFRLSYLIQKGGGENVKLSYINETLSLVYPHLQIFTQEANRDLIALNEKYYSVSLSDGTCRINIPIVDSGIYEKLTKKPSTWDTNYSNYYTYDSASKYYKNNDSNKWDDNIEYFELTGNHFKSVYFMLYINDDNETKGMLKLACKGNDGFIVNKKVKKDAETNDLTLTDGYNLIEICPINRDNSELTLSYTDGDEAADLSRITVTMSKMCVVDDWNPLLSWNDGCLGSIYNSQKNSNDGIASYLYRKFAIPMEKFYPIQELDKHKLIELSDNYPMSSAQAFYDPNNVANKWTIGCIDFENMNIRISRNSMK